MTSRLAPRSRARSAPSPQCAPSAQRAPLTPRHRAARVPQALSQLAQEVGIGEDDDDEGSQEDSPRGDDGGEPGDLESAGGGVDAMRGAPRSASAPGLRAGASLRRMDMMGSCPDRPLGLATVRKLVSSGELRSERPTAADRSGQETERAERSDHSRSRSKPPSNRRELPSTQRSAAAREGREIPFYKDSAKAKRKEGSSSKEASPGRPKPPGRQATIPVEEYADDHVPDYSVPGGQAAVAAVTAARMWKKKAVASRETAGA